MFAFKPINSNIYSKSITATSPDALYWKALGVPVLVKEFGAIDYIDFSPIEPHYFAVTCSVRVQIYNPITKLVAKNLSKFQENAYGGSFRKDGRLLVAGDEQGSVKLFDVSSKTILRVFKGHKAPVHRAFFNSDNIHVSSFSDDKTVKLWDIATEKSICSFNEHNDYIRAGCTNPVSPNILLSGGYDSIIKMYDTRTNESVMELNHGSPVESIIFLPTGGIFISSGGTDIKVWDALSGGRLISQISQHHKTVTCLQLASNGKRLLSGSLDRHVKIYDVATYQVVHNLDFPNAVLSVGVSANDDTLVAGMVDGLVSIQRREEDSVQEKKPERTIIENHNNRFDEVIERFRYPKIDKYEKFLRKFEYTKALDAVLDPNVALKNPQVTVAVMQELIRRKGLQRALVGRSHKSIAAIVRFLYRNIIDYRFTKILTDVTNILLDVYEDNFHEFRDDLGKYFIVLLDYLKAEEAITLELLHLQGALDLILSASTVDEQSIEIEYNKTYEALKPSNDAKQDTVINVN